MKALIPMTRHPFGVPSPWLTCDEAADYAHVSLGQMRDLVIDGKVAAYSIGSPSDWTVNREELDALIRSRPVDPARLREARERELDRGGRGLMLIDLDTKTGKATIEPAASAGRRKAQ